MIIAPLGFESLPPLYNPSVGFEIISTKLQSTTQTNSALEAVNPSNLKSAPGKSTLQSSSSNLKKPTYTVPLELSVVGTNLVGESILSVDYVDLLIEKQADRFPINTAIEAYKGAEKPLKIVNHIFVA